MQAAKEEAAKIMKDKQAACESPVKGVETIAYANIVPAEAKKAAEAAKK
jgi:hypothetical protein